MISWEIFYDIKNKYVGLSTILYFKQILNSNKEAKFLDYSLKLDFFWPHPRENSHLSCLTGMLW